ncbi:hypothetical protein NFI96_013633 [Prochilodus magdalenae]|nr:hypothetical protein NFI96_013633 [Prochilodus magdalenae]
MSAKRCLPSWMTTGESSAGRHSDATLSSSRSTTKRPAAHTPRGATQRPERVMMYWMNERELMETALGFLKKNDVMVRHRRPQAAAEVSIIPETDSEDEPDSDAQESSTCESDKDVAEQETVPYITCTEKERSSRRSDSTGDIHPTHSQAQPELEDNPLRTKPDAEALELVREIFFS